MRRLLLLTLLIPVFSYAGKVTEQQALLKAQQFLEGKSFRLPEKARKIKSLGQSCDSMGFYVFNVEENGGFVIVSGDDRTKDILGYAESGHLDLNNLPDHISWWLNTYTKAISSLSNNNSVQQTIKKESKAEILPLIKTQWAQDSPYSDQCIINGTQCATGCAATAMAQVMNYWKWPTSVEAMNGYTVGSQTVNALPKTLFNWKDMTDADKAKLCRYCGQSINMEYGPIESAASSVIIPVSLVKIFGYDAGTHTVYREGYPLADWEDLIYGELSASRPVIYCGSSPTNYAHAFICDGYKDGLYHINWGWGGLHDTYFVLTVLDAYGKNNLSHTFSENQFAIIGIQKPNGGSTEDYSPLTMTKMEVLSNLSFTRESIALNFKGIVLNWELSNSLINDMNAEIIIALYQDDELIRKIVTHPLTTLNPGLYLNQMIAINFGTRVSDGTYQLKIVYADENGTIHFPQGHDYRYVKAIIRENTMTLKNYPRPDGEDDPEEPISYAYGEQFDWNTNEGIITLEVTSTSPKTVKIVKGSTSLSGDVNIPESIKDYQVTEISDFAFADCTNISAITLPSNVTIVGAHAFQHTGLKEFYAPEGLEVINSMAFDNCTDLKYIYISKTVTDIAEDAFLNCTNRERFDVQAGNPVYDSRDNCGALIRTSNNDLLWAGLNSVIPESVTAITGRGWSFLSNLTSIHIGKNVQQCSNAFENCINLTSITIDDGNTCYESPEGSNVIYDVKNLSISRGCINSTIPNKTRSIGNLAFNGITGLKNIHLPEGLEDIGQKAFDGCESLESLTFPISLKSIQECGFANCTSLTTIALSVGPVELDTKSFEGCPLTSVTSLCKEPLPISDDVFSKAVYNNAILFVPNGSAEKYKKTSGWKMFKTIQELPAVILGDIDGDGSVTEEDINVLTDFLANIDTNSFNSVQAADANEDGCVDIRDVTTIINQLTGHTPTEGLPQNITFRRAFTYLCPGQSVEMNIGALDASGIQFSILLPKGFSFGQMVDEENGISEFLLLDDEVKDQFKVKYRVEDRMMTAIAYSPKNSTTYNIAKILVNVTEDTMAGAEFETTQKGICSNEGGKTVDDYSYYNSTWSIVDGYTLTKVSEHGRIILNPNSNKYPSGYKVWASAIPDKGYEFVKWGDGETVQSRQLIIDKDMVLNAFFEKVHIIISAESIVDAIKGIVSNYWTIDREAYDMNGDGEVTIADIIIMANTLLQEQ